MAGGLTLNTGQPSGSSSSSGLLDFSSTISFGSNTAGGDLASLRILLPILIRDTAIFRGLQGGAPTGSLTLDTSQLTIASLGTALSNVVSNGLTLVGGGTIAGSATSGTSVTLTGGVTVAGSSGSPLTVTSATGNITSAITVNSGTVNLATGGLNLPNLTVGQTGTATIANTSGTPYSLNLSNGTTVSLAAGGTLTITGGSPYVTGASPVALSISISNPVQVTPAN